MRCGPLKHTHFMCCKEKQLSGHQKKASTLWMTFTNDKNLIHLHNLLPKLKQFSECLERWKKHNLTPICKLAVIKTFALPKLIYPLTRIRKK